MMNTEFCIACASNRVCRTFSNVDKCASLFSCFASAGDVQQASPSFGFSLIFVFAASFVVLLDRISAAWRN